MIGYISSPNKFGGKNTVVGELGRTEVLQQRVLLLWPIQQGYGVWFLLAQHVGGVKLSVKERKLQVFLIRSVIHLFLLFLHFCWFLRQEGFLTEEAIDLNGRLFADLQMMHLQQVLPPVPFLLTDSRKQKLLLLPGF